jgi:glycosyltransferase involved in cell wall biosynthesis
MRVLHVISNIDPSLGGTSTALIELARAQRRVPIDVSVLSTFNTPSDLAADQLRRDGVSVSLVGPTDQPLMRHPEIEPALRQRIHEFDVVHIHALWEEIQHRAAVVARETNIPYVITPHGMLDPWSLRQSKWKKKIYLALRMRKNLNRAAAIHYTSDIERDLARRLRLKARTIVEPNGVDLGEFDDLPPHGAFRIKHELAGNRPIVLFLGRLHPKKGLDLLIPAFAGAAPQNAVLIIVGPEGQEGYLEHVRGLAKQHEIADRVIFTGMLRGRARIEALVDADLFCLPSHQENFGIAVVEALAAGCPVLISDQVNIHREITAAGVGVVVPMDVEALRTAMYEWLSQPHLRAEASTRAPAFVRRRYDWNVIAQHWAAHYAKLTEEALG